MAQRIIYICDRCFKEYIRENKVETKENGNRLIGDLAKTKIVLYGSDYSRPTDAESFQGAYELCPQCGGEFIDWICRPRRQNETLKMINNLSLVQEKSK